MKTLTLNTKSLMTVISSLSEAKAVIKEALEESIDALTYAKEKYIIKCIESKESNYNFNELIEKNNSFLLSLVENVNYACFVEDFDGVDESEESDIIEMLEDLSVQIEADYRELISNISLANKIEQGNLSLEDRSLILEHGAQRKSLESDPIKGYFFN
jgi:hypothetical protein